MPKALECLINETNAFAAHDVLLMHCRDLMLLHLETVTVTYAQ